MEENLVDVRYEPVKEVVIKQTTFFLSPDDLARFASIISGGRSRGVYWAEGVVFLNFPLQASTETVVKALVDSGKVYWTFLGYALMPSYRPIIETKEKIMIPVIDMSSNAMLKKVVKWIKQKNEDLTK